MISSPDDFYLKQTEPNKSSFLALRNIILESDSELTETTKYGIPCFCFQTKPVCYLWKDKKTTEPYILWVDGNLLNHPALEAGNRKRMKILRINPMADLPINTILEIREAALELAKKRTKK